ncbi:MAG: hypothetical protein VKK62_08585 [Synechococcaceae cyanobacterium]|nr:hypothetical protein [Synechococcaceae cyanobacterium]
MVDALRPVLTLLALSLLGTSPSARATQAPSTWLAQDTPPPPGFSFGGANDAGSSTTPSDNLILTPGINQSIRLNCSARLKQGPASPGAQALVGVTLTNQGPATIASGSFLHWSVREINAFGTITLSTPLLIGQSVSQGKMIPRPASVQQTVFPCGVSVFSTVQKP